MKAPADRGAALVTVLAMVTIMGALAAVAVEASQFSLRRAANQAGMEQARLYLLGAESYARAKAADLARAETPPDAALWNGRTLTYPLDAGVMTVRVRDGSNCFNLNSLVERSEDGALVASAAGKIRFARLLDALGAPAASGLGPALADYLDTDSRPSPGGVEDDPRPAANTLMVDAGELAYLRGADPELLAALAPYVCTRGEGASVLNVNTLTADSAPLLVAIFGDDLPLSAARALIRNRPVGGWPDLDAFFAQTGLESAPQTRALFDVRPHYYRAHARVEIAGAAESVAFLMAADGHVVRRLFGAGAAEHAL